MQRKSLFILFFVFLVLSIFLVQQVNACGCGIALEDMKVFNALKETQAYLMIDINSNNGFDEMPFFKMVSLEEPYNVTIVFPIDGIPYDVQGKRISANSFLREQNIDVAEKYFERQSFSELVKKIGKDISESSSTVFTLSNGLVGSFFWVSTRIFSAGGAMKFGGMLSESTGPVAHFEFEGGSMDIYDVKSMNTLDELVKKLNITATGKVKELVTKYKDYFVAVLYLNIQSVLNEEERARLSMCPEQTAEVKKALQEKTSFTYEEISQMTMGPCYDALQHLVWNVVNSNSDINGTLVIMKFNSTDQFFYPTSIVNSYNYPVTDQRYLIRAPSYLDIKLESSSVSKTAILESERWYKVTSSKEDIRGRIINAGISVKIMDKLRLINQAFYDNSRWFAFVIYLIIISLPFVFYSRNRDEGFGKKDIGLTISLFLLGGLLLSAIVMLVRKKKRFALTLFILWLVLLIIMILSKAFMG